jgi:hypothetical protein
MVLAIQDSQALYGGGILDLQRVVNSPGSLRYPSLKKLLKVCDLGGEHLNKPSQMNQGRWTRPSGKEVISARADNEATFCEYRTVTGSFISLRMEPQCN